MQWTQIDIKVSTKDIEKAAAIAHMVVPHGIYIEDYSDIEQVAFKMIHADKSQSELIDKELLKKDKSHGVIHIYISPKDNPIEAVAFLTDRLNSENIRYSIDSQSIKEENWANNWKQYFKPMEIGKKLLICPTWVTPPPLNQRKLLKIDPGMAFGTGTHETTRLVLEMMEQYIKPQQKVLDVGCGSGILSVASMLLGANSVLGIDIDALAVSTAQDNGKLNNMTLPEYEIVKGDLAKSVKGKFDIVLANIVADAVIQLSKDVPSFLNSDGVYIVSGIIDTKKQLVIDSLKSYGFKLVKTKELDGWVSIAWELNA